MVTDRLTAGWGAIPGFEARQASCCGGASAGGCGLTPSCPHFRFPPGSRVKPLAAGFMEVAMRIRQGIADVRVLLFSIQLVGQLVSVLELWM